MLVVGLISIGVITVCIIAKAAIYCVNYIKAMKETVGDNDDKSSDL